MATRIIIWLVPLVFLVFCASCSSQPATPTSQAGTNAIIVPQGAAPTLDGVLSPGEWDRAHREAFSDGSELFLLFNDSYLYLAIHSSTPEMIAGNVLVAAGDEIIIMHSSAALGTGRYAKGIEAWQLTQPFDWQVRDYSQSAAAQAARQAFLEQEGWLASNSRAGDPETLEYQIKIMASPVILAVNFIKTSDTNTKIVWPVGLKDDTIKPTPGGLPEEMFFTPQHWAVIQLPD